jgi:misacylated tRNA(Ala) deacylase
VVAVRESELAFDRTCFYPGGGGQPADEGTVELAASETLEIISARADADEIIWHMTRSAPPANLVGRPAKLRVNKARRLALARYHTVLHVLNTIALRDYGGWITGVQIGVDQSRIDFKLEALSAALCAEIERKVNAVLAGDHAVKACGGTHVDSTAELGRFAIVRTENKGKINKRLYVRLDDSASRAEGR